MTRPGQIGHEVRIQTSSEVVLTGIANDYTDPRPDPMWAQRGVPLTEELQNPDHVQRCVWRLC